MVEIALSATDVSSQQHSKDVVDIDKLVFLKTILHTQTTMDPRALCVILYSCFGFAVLEVNRMTIG